MMGKTRRRWQPVRNYTSTQLQPNNGGRREREGGGGVSAAYSAAFKHVGQAWCENVVFSSLNAIQHFRSPHFLSHKWPNHRQS